MSDCSTNAMKPKERPKTCGNCGHGVQTNVFCHCSDGSTSGLHSLNEHACRQWISQPSLEQRCQQLEQVAIQAYKWFVGAGEERFRVGKEEASFMREQLEALGVSLDD